MASSDKKLVIGRFGKTHGLKGWLRIYSVTSPIENILQYQPWQIIENGHYIELKVTDTREHSESFLVHIEGYDTPESAKGLIGQAVFMDQEQLPTLSPDQYYWSDLEGLSVYNVHGALIGEVDYLMEAGACDVMVIKGDKKEILIPFDKQHVIKSVDLKQRKIVVDYHAG